MLLFVAAKLQSFRKEGMWLVGADDFLILASSVKPCIIDLEMISCGQKEAHHLFISLPEGLQTIPYSLAESILGSNAITGSPKGQANQTVWPCGHWGWGAAVCMWKWSSVHAGVSLYRCPSATQWPSKTSSRIARGFESGFPGT